MISEMDPANPKSVCDESMLPQELLAIGHGVNQLAERVEKAMQREKRTTSSLAHELMTPISELRSMVEINKMYPEDPEVRNNFYRRTDRIVSEMQVMAEKVVQMARYEDAVDELQNREFDLLVEVENGLDLVAQRVREKGLHISFDSCLDSIVFGDQAIAKIVVGNLIANAVSHCPQGGHLGVRFETDESNLWLHLSNTNWGLEPQDLEFITERYWHKGPEGQAAKTGSGLGLALVHDLTAHAGFEFEFGLRGTDVLVRLGIPLAAAAEQESD
jgi:signal transduction histidine kinase